MKEHNQIKRSVSRKNTELRHDVDVGWRYFWAKRGHKEPPWVCTSTIGIFDLPVSAIQDAKDKKKI